MTTDFGLMDSADVAAATGMKLTSFRVALTRSKGRRLSGSAIPSDIPQPDRIIGRSPVWNRETIEEWLTVRDAVKRIGLRAYLAAQVAGEQSTTE